MQYRRLGNSNITVSVICLGTMTYGEQNTKADAHRQLDYALDHGVNFIDTAEMYAVPARPETQGLTETYIGTWLQQRKDRERIVLATKIAGPGEWIKHIRGGPRLSASQITTAIDDSLRRLNTDYIDLYQLHWPERATNYFGKLGYQHQSDQDGIAIGETLEALGTAVAAGKLRCVGISNETPWGLAEYLRLASEQNLPRIVSIQNPYNLLNRSFEIGLAEMAIREQVGLLAYSPLGFGVLSGKYLSEQPPADSRLVLFPQYGRYLTEAGKLATRRYVELAHDHGVSPSQLALAFVTARCFVTSTIIGATTMHQLTDNIASSQLTLSDALYESIEQIHNDYPNPCP